MFKRTSKSLFKPKIVKPVDGSSKLKSAMKPFPSHFGPKIRHKKRPQAAETNKNIVKRAEKKEKGAKIVTQAKQEKVKIFIEVLILNVLKYISRIYKYLHELN